MTELLTQEQKEEVLKDIAQKAKETFKAVTIIVHYGNYAAAQIYGDKNDVVDSIYSAARQVPELRSVLANAGPFKTKEEKHES